MLLGMIPVGPMGANCYIIGDGESHKGIVVDPGDEADAILRNISDLKIDVELIVNTHAHFDHTMALAKVKAATGAKFALHPREVPILKSQPSFPWLGPMDTRPDPDLLVNDGDKIGVEGIELTVIHTPGHTPGGICLLGEGFVITGDTLFALGVGRTDIPGGNWEQLLQSIKERLFVLPDETVVLPGHGPRSKIGVEKLRNPFVGSLTEID